MDSTPHSSTRWLNSKAAASAPTSTAPAVPQPSTTGVKAAAPSTTRKFQPSSGLNLAMALHQLALATDFATRQGSYILMQQLSQYIGIVGIDNFTIPGSILVPNTFKEAMTSPHSAKWLAATKKGHQSLLELNVLELLSPDDIPPEHNITGSCCLFKVKRDGRFKGRVVATGRSQRHDIVCGKPSRQSAVSRASGFYSPSLQPTDGA